MVEKHKAKLKEIEKQRLSGLQSLADKIAQQSITIEANANDEGHLYGSVGSTEIVAALKAIDITITDDQVRLAKVHSRNLACTLSRFTCIRRSNAT